MNFLERIFGKVKEEPKKVKKEFKPIKLGDDTANDIWSIRLKETGIG